MKDLINQLLEKLQASVTPDLFAGAYPMRADAVLLQVLTQVKADGLDAPMFTDLVDRAYVVSEAEFILNPNADNEDTTDALDVAGVIRHLAENAHRCGAPVETYLHESIRAVAKEKEGEA
jgi:hypothetical protein